jgi:Phage integrase, N-terminal SAM-like domain
LCAISGGGAGIKGYPEGRRNSNAPVFTANIRNRNTRRAYAQAVREFLDWCETHHVRSITAVQPIHVAGYIEELTRERLAPTPSSGEIVAVGSSGRCRRRYSECCCDQANPAQNADRCRPPAGVACAKITRSQAKQAPRWQFGQKRPFADRSTTLSRLKWRLVTRLLGMGPLTLERWPSVPAASSAGDDLRAGRRSASRLGCRNLDRRHQFGDHRWQCAEASR